MKKIVFLLSIIALFVCLVSCELLPFGGEDTGVNPGGNLGDIEDKPGDKSEDPVTPDTPVNPTLPDDPQTPNTPENPDVNNQLPESVISVSAVKGLNEQIYVGINATEGYE